MSVILQTPSWTLVEIEAALEGIANNILGKVTTPQQPLMEIGLDSLAAVEMQNAISITFGDQELPITFVFDYPTISAMARYLMDRTRLIESAEPTPSSTSLIAFAGKEALDQAFHSTEIIAISCRYPRANPGSSTATCTTLPKM